ncbi:NAD(P)-binding protein [Mesorhizobium sp.]|uniref:NAD(P)-binding protein n=1 Tax=Mesorhizobium sp. TaxID=1871066 RepID=UPI00257BA0A6|nr:NAD(P)-binding protein [Mesorhizobium sp.]
MIGAGAAGLAAAHALIKAGVPTLVLEKESRLAEPWYPRPERLHLNSHRDLSTLPGVDYPAGTPAFPHKNAVVRYLNEFSRRMVCRSGLASPSRRSRSTAITGLLRPVQGEADPKLPGLWFTGMRPSIRGCFANARIQANAIAQQIVRQGR